MPTERVRVRKVSEWPDARGRDFTVYVIGTEELDWPHVQGPTVTTTNPWKASLCKEALNQRRVVSLEWRVFRGTQKDLVTVTLLEQVA